MIEVPIELLRHDVESPLWELIAELDQPVHVVAGKEPEFPLFHFLFAEGVRRRGIPVRRIVDVTSGIPARWYGIDGMKGSFDPGSHGDLFVFDPDSRDPYRDLDWPGRIICSVQRGEMLLYNGQLHSSPSHGRNLSG